VVAVADLPEFAEATVLRQGDTLVVRVARPFSADEADAARATFAEKLPGVSVVFVQADEMLVRRGLDPDEIVRGGDFTPDYVAAFAGRPDGA
jgi:hypothetical protein